MRVEGRGGTSAVRVFEEKGHRAEVRGDEISRALHVLEPIPDILR